MNFEASDDRYDPQMGFSQFLEEARQHASSMNSKTTLKHQGDGGERRLGCEEEEKKVKKSWKRKVLSWLKSDKKGKTNKVVSKEGSGPRRFHVSGPIHGGERKEVHTKLQRPVSGPISLTSLFNPNKRVDTEVPYMCLDSNLNSPKFHSQQGLKPYGPVYLVT